MPTAITFLGFPDPVSELYTTIYSPGSVPSTLPLTNLQTDEPSEKTRILSLDPINSQIAFDFAGVEKDIDGFSIINHNLTPGNHYRFIGLSTPGSLGWTYETQAPNAVTASSNVSGGVTNIDEAISSPDGLKMEPFTPTLAWNVRLGFAALSHTPNTATGRGFFVVRARLEASGIGLDTLATLPRLLVDLRQQGSPVVIPLGYRAVQTSAAGGQVLIFPFEFSSLADPTGADIEVQLTFTPGTSTAGSMVYGTLESVRLYYERFPAVTTGYSTDCDTGWIAVPDVGGDFEQIPTSSAHCFLGERWTGIQSLILLVRSDQADHAADFNFSDGAIPYQAVETPSDFVEMGIVETGESKVLTYGLNAEPGPVAGPYTSAMSETGLTGQSYTADLFSGRRTDAMTLTVTKAEKTWLQREIGWKRGLSVPFFAALEPGEEAEDQMFTAAWWTLAADLGMPKRLGRSGSQDELVYEMTIELREKL